MNATLFRQAHVVNEGAVKVQDVLISGPHEEKRRGGDVSRNINIGAGQGASTLKADNAILSLHGVPKTRQHALGVVPGRRGLGHAGLTSGIKTSQQYAGFDLRAGHWQVIVQARQYTPSLHFERGAALARTDQRAHL